MKLKMGRYLKYVDPLCSSTAFVNGIEQSSIIMDATRISDGRVVAIKRVIPGDNFEETEIVQYLNGERLRSDVRNNAVPALDVLEVPETERDGPCTLLVMPLLRPFDDPWFETYGEVVAFFTQMLNVCDPASHRSVTFH